MGCTATTSFKKKPETIKIRNVDEIKVDPSIFVMENKKNFQDVYRVTQSLASGTFGEVKICFHRESGQKRAVKLFRRELMNSTDDSNQLLKEISILRNLDHPNIIRTFEFFEDSKRLYLVMEYCGGGELFTEILKRQSFSEEDSAKIFFQILSAVSYLHSKGIVHGDLSPENILLEEKHGSLNVKIADFGSAVLNKEKRFANADVGKAYYTAPEVYEGVMTENSDMWSLGVILYILLCGHPPFDGENDEQIISLVKRAKVSKKGKIWSQVSPSAKDLIDKLICSSSNRLTSIQAISHEWVNSHHHVSGLRGTFTDVISNLKAFHAPHKLKDAIMTYLTSQFSSVQETKELREVFFSLDKNGDGHISKEELIQHFSPTMGIIPAEEEAEKILKQVDTDSNGFIDYTEFLKVNLDSKVLLSDEHLKIAFALFDYDGDGKISPAELKKLLEGNRESDENLWTNIVKSLDANGDGEIDLQEFKAIVRSNIL